jgi:glycosyltransferase involved in cell wall biosynthesis
LASARQRHPQLGERGKMMLPGIDQPFRQLPPYRAGEKFVIGHFGSLSPTRHLGPILTALEQLGARRPELLKPVELHVYGGPLDKVSAELLVNSPVRGAVRHFGRIEADPQTGFSGREQILHRMRSVDVLLLLHGEDAMCAEYIPSKLYEYLWMQRPILAIVHHNPQMAALIRGQGHVAVISGHGVDSQVVAAELATALEQLAERWRTVGLADNDQTSPYTTEAAVGQLLGWVDDLSKGKR